MASWWKRGTDSLGLTNYQDVERTQNQLKHNQELAKETQAQNQKLIEQMYGNAQDFYGQGAAQYDQRLSDYENMPTYQAQHYEYDKDVNDFLSPARNMRVNQAMNAIQNSRANAGSMFSSDTMNEMNNKAQLMASEEWDKAYDRMMKDRDVNLNEWKVNADENREQYKSQLERSKDLLNLANNDRNGMFNASQNYYANLVNNNNAAMSTQAGIGNAMANAGMNQQGIGSGLFKLGAGIVSALI